MTSGELGSTVNEMEIQLAQAFRIAKEWNAVFLLGDVDVFLSKRSADNLEKNAFASVFLQWMEYYQGILFLTTNRAEDFDPAFMSRIHLMIDYQPLNEHQRTRIWRNLAAGMHKDETLDEKGLKALGTDYNINGHQIKNLLRTSWCSAKEAGKPLSISHVRTVARISQRPGMGKQN